jgi:hypothetical protein
LNLLNSHPKNVIAPTSKIPKGIPTPNPIARDLSVVVPCVEVGFRVAEVVKKEVCCVVDGRGVVDGDVVVVKEEEIVVIGGHILTAVDAIEGILKNCLLSQQLVGSKP